MLRGDELLKEVLEGRMLGKRRTGKIRKEMIDVLNEESFVK